MFAARKESGKWFECSIQWFNDQNVVIEVNFGVEISRFWCSNWVINHKFYVNLSALYQCLRHSTASIRSSPRRFFWSVMRSLVCENTRSHSAAMAGIEKRFNAIWTRFGQHTRFDHHHSNTLSTLSGLMVEYSANLSMIVGSGGWSLTRGLNKCSYSWIKGEKGERRFAIFVKSIERVIRNVRKGV